MEAKIAERWQHYVDDPTPRWADIVIDKPGITRHGKDIGVQKVVFGIGTFFHVGRPSDHFALKEHTLSKLKIPLMNGEASFTIISDSQGNILSLGKTDAIRSRGEPSSSASVIENGEK